MTTSLASSSPELDEKTFFAVRDRVRSTTGILLQDNVRFVVGRRLWARCQMLGKASFRDYLKLLNHVIDGVRELDELIELIVVNETYFFRETEQLRAVNELILPELFQAKEDQHVVRLWSAGCSTGEEAFTLAMLIDEAFGKEPNRCDIFASDISRRVLRHARGGAYRQISFRETSSGRKSRYFEEQGDSFLLCPEIRRRVTFAHINLTDATALHLVANMDVIVCRNVLIYFDREARKQIVEMFFRKLRPGGYLLLGLSESLVGDSHAFEMKASPFGLIYRKPLVARTGLVSSASQEPRR